MAGKRERIEPREGEQRYVRRDEQGQFTDSQDDVGRSTARDQKSKSKTESKRGHGDRGDRPKSR